MFVFSLCQQLCPDKLPVQPEIRLADGADGEILTVKNDPSRVIKLGVLYEYPSLKLEKAYANIDKVLEYVIRTQPQSYVRVFQHGALGIYTRKNIAFYKGEQRFHLYYYLMEKLQKISEDELKVFKKLFHSILLHGDRVIKKDFSEDKIKKILKGSCGGLDFDAEKVIIFCENIKKAPLSHLDIHITNIMRDELGNFKLVDLDRVKLE